MDLATLYTFIGDLTNDPNHDRYTTSQINTELDDTQDDWNVQARILTDTVTLTTVSGQRQYPLSGFTGTPIAFPRATHKGLDLIKKEKSWFDLYSSEDWTTTTGTPKYFGVEATDPDVQNFIVYPTPTDSDVGDNLVSEYVKRHTPMSATTDEPFNSNTLLRPYHWGIGYDVAAKLLSRDPSQENALKASAYKKTADEVLASVVQTFKAIERSEPMQVKQPVKINRYYK
jgi:hypothetical protein